MMYVNKVVFMYDEWSLFYDLLGLLMLVLVYRNWVIMIFIFNDLKVKLKID